MASVSGGSVGDTGTECEGEDPDESSSSNSNDILDASPMFDNLTLNDSDTQGKDGEDILSVFRQQWQRELVSSPQRQLYQAKQGNIHLEPENEEDRVTKAKQLFLRGVELERCGKLYEAVQHYKRAVQLLPDVESRLYHTLEPRAETPEVIPEETPEVTEEVVPSDDEDEDEDSEDGTGDLVARFQRILARKGRLCEPEHPHKSAHISWLPYELVLLVLRWTISSELDALSLERVSATCRGFYVAARDPDVWRALCVRTWGLNCGNPKSFGYTSWRDMYVDRPRLRLHGCYISKTTYLRHGENSFQDQFYKPWYLIGYYRYLRFFPEGVVLMWTTAEEPASCVGQLRHRAAKNSQGIMSGHYRLVADKVIIVVKKQAGDKKPAQASNTRFRSRRKDASHDQQLQTFHLELQLKTVRSRRNWQLCWRAYAVSTRRDAWTTFDLVPGKYPPFTFSRVKQYHAEADAPLP